MLGRHPNNDLMIKHIGVSRFHGMIVKNPSDKFYIINYGINEIAYQKPGSFEKSEVGSLWKSRAFMTSELGKDVSQIIDPKGEKYDSLMELIEQQECGNVPQIPGFKPRGFTKKEHVQYLINWAENKNEVFTLCGFGQKLENEYTIYIKGCKFKFYID